MIWDCCPKLTKCCFCVTDLKTASAIIAVLGIVTSPAVSWAVVRHSYVIRVSCVLTSREDRKDVVDVHLSHFLSFGFGANAGLGPSCLDPEAKPDPNDLPPSKPPDTTDVPKYNFYLSVKWVGWVVLLADFVFLIYSIFFLYRLYQPRSAGYQASLILQFMWACIVSIALSFVYSMLYVSACITVGGSFPVFEFFFSFFDVILWGYFIAVINSYSDLVGTSQRT
ncbi:unnamed protein product [Arctia plantaginis]|uniref:MARVEL domain-containing protein n=1 Tax=Arctia plantaginis TaxID=874455 RepID=A0A8S0ZPX2_ARCPL|nr:unnamed protein product [Arctia plantaginis]CAB3250658.1 unnamed protein product [Arctia plantaginis]